MEIFGSLLDNSTSVDFGFEHNTDGLDILQPAGPECWDFFYETAEAEQKTAYQARGSNLIAVTLVHQPVRVRQDEDPS